MKSVKSLATMIGVIAVLAFAFAFMSVAPSVGAFATAHSASPASALAYHAVSPSGADEFCPGGATSC